jgi:hypothetical protein
VRLGRIARLMETFGDYVEIRVAME